MIPLYGLTLILLPKDIYGGSKFIPWTLFSLSKLIPHFVDASYWLSLY